MAAIEVEDLRRSYGGRAAVDGVSFTVAPGEVVALVGPNGAGKTTTVEILEGHRRRDGGRVRVLGFDPGRRERALYERIGIVLQEAGFEEEFTVRELVSLYRGTYPRRRSVEGVLAQVGLTGEADSRVRTLSGGQRRRLDLALGIVGDPELLFLDEPTTGFDPVARRRAWDVVDGLRAQGTTVLLTTHDMAEAEHLADRVGVLVAGRLVALGRPEQMLALVGGAVVTFRLDGPTAGGLPELPGVLGADGLDHRLTTTRPTEAVRVLTAWASARGVEVAELTVRRPTLEDVYLRLVDGHREDRPAPSVPAGATTGGAP